MATSAPCARHRSHFSFEPAVTITRRPASLPSVVAAVPTPLPPPWTSSVSPALARASSNTLRNAVRNTSGIAPASSFAQRVGHAHGRAVMHHDLLGVAAAGEQGHGALAAGPAAHVRADLDHVAGALQAEDWRRAGRRRVA